MLISDSFINFIGDIIWSILKKAFIITAFTAQAWNVIIKTFKYDTYLFLNPQPNLSTFRSFHKSVSKKSFLMFCGSPVTICLWCISLKREFLHLHSNLSQFLIHLTSQSRCRSKTIFGSIKIPTIFINYTPLFSKNTAKVCKF